MIHPMQLIMVAEGFVGTPFKERGRSHTGLDCYGLVMRIYEGVGIHLEDFDYEPGWYKQGMNHFLENYHNYFVKITERERRVGDLVFFQNWPKVVNHAGIVLTGAAFIHVLRKAGVVINKLSHDPFARRVQGYYRLKELCESA